MQSVLRSSDFILPSVPAVQSNGSHNVTRNREKSIPLEPEHDIDLRGQCCELCSPSDRYLNESAATRATLLARVGRFSSVKAPVGGKVSPQLQADLDYFLRKGEPMMVSDNLHSTRRVRHVPPCCRCPRRCLGKVALVMVDSRRVQEGSAHELAGKDYFSRAVRVNAAFAERHGYDLVVYRADSWGGDGCTGLTNMTVQAPGDKTGLTHLPNISKVLPFLADHAERNPSFRGRACRGPVDLPPPHRRQLIDTGPAKVNTAVYDFTTKQWRSAPWAKVPALYEMSYLYDWVAYIDSDAMFANHSVPLSDVTAAMQPQHVLATFSDMPYSYMAACTGFVVMRSGARARTLLRRWWATDSGTATVHAYEQTAYRLRTIAREGRTRGMFDGDFASSVIEVEYRQFDLAEARGPSDFSFPPVLGPWAGLFVHIGSGYPGNRGAAMASHPDWGTISSTNLTLLDSIAGVSAASPRIRKRHVSMLLITAHMYMGL